MQAIMSLTMGYFIGCINPAALVGRLKKVNLREKGTGNLGATNTAFILGKKAGIFVMLFDIFKSYFSARLARYLFPQLVAAGLVACIGVILGHCFPVFLQFHGGKGLAAFGGMVLAYKPVFFLQIVLPGVLLMLITNSGAVMPVLASSMFPVLIWRNGGTLPEILAAVLAGVLLLAVHRGNLRDARNRKDGIFVKEFFRKVFPKD